MNIKINIGLEIHVQLSCNSKLFSSSPVVKSGEEEPQKYASYYDGAIPGTLPLLNKKSIELAVKTSLALNCRVNKESYFDRKHYRYPDLPLGYQITQYYKPIANDGYLIINGKKIRIKRIHLETDAGKILHYNAYSLLDLNRVGVSLIEIVTEADINSPEEASAFVEELIFYIKTVGSSDCNMESGNLRMDVNVSIPKEDGSLGTRVEIKNLNSLKFMRDAIEVEGERQRKLIENNEELIQSTRGYDSQKKITYELRGKEEYFSYRYIMDNNIPPCILEDSFIEKAISELPILPHQRRIKYRGLISEEYISTLLRDLDLANYYDETIEGLNRDLSIIVSNLVINNLVSIANKTNKSPYEYPKEWIRYIAKLLLDKDITNRGVKKLMEESFISNKSPHLLFKELNIKVIKDRESLKKIAEEVINKNPKEVLRYKEGEVNLIKFLLGKGISISGGEVDPLLLEESLKESIDNIQ